MELNYFWLYYWITWEVLNELKLKLYIGYGYIENSLYALYKSKHAVNLLLMGKEWEMGVGVGAPRKNELIL